MNYTTTATQIFQNNQQVGWWTDKTTGLSLVGCRPLGTVAALIHSELSEGMEGLRKNLSDDHLPHRPMVEVEVADCAIRAYDFLGSELVAGNLVIDDELVEYGKGYVKATLETFSAVTPIDYISTLHSLVSEGYSESAMITTGGDRDIANITFAEMCLTVIIGCEKMAEDFGYDLTGAINEKLAYNLNRADHKVENREKEGGKQF